MKPGFAGAGIAHGERNPSGLAIPQRHIEVQPEPAIGHGNGIEDDRPCQRGAGFRAGVDHQLHVIAAIGRLAAIIELALVDKARCAQWGRCQRQQQRSVNIL